MEGVGNNNNNNRRLVTLAEGVGDGFKMECWCMGRNNNKNNKNNRFNNMTGACAAILN